MTVLVLAHFLIVTVFTARILLRDDLSPPARLAWFIVLNALPFLGSMAYFLFGEVDLGNHENTRHDQIFAEVQPHALSVGSDQQAAYDMIEPIYRPAFRYAASINGFHPVLGNTANLMPDAQTTIDRIIEDIDAAKEHVHVLNYIWLGDQTGERLADALIRAVHRGVTCRAMADGLGSRGFIKSETWARMRDAGVLVAVSLPLGNPLRTLLTSRIDLRNHRKITVVDNKISYCGSRNAADPEFRIKAKYAPWVDIMLRFEGPVVIQNALLFMSDWMQATGEPLGAFAAKPIVSKTGFAAQVIGDGPTERPGATPQLFSSLIACAQSRMMISTPYFVPDGTVLEALCAAAHRGVRVQLIFPKANDSWIVAAASRSYYRKLLSAGCEIFEFEGGLLHAKTLTLDDRVTLVGSSNIDLRSFDLNYENNILLQDNEATLEVQKRQRSYIAQSEHIKLNSVLKWPRHKRIWNNVIATIGPVL
jgi:cardiolipin synthase